jgi:hypothetical protein
MTRSEIRKDIDADHHGKHSGTIVSTGHSRKSHKHASSESTNEVEERNQRHEEHSPQERKKGMRNKVVTTLTGAIASLIMIVNFATNVSATSNNINNVIDRANEIAIVDIDRSNGISIVDIDQVRDIADNVIDRSDGISINIVAVDRSNNIAIADKIEA